VSDLQLKDSWQAMVLVMIIVLLITIKLIIYQIEWLNIVQNVTFVLFIGLLK